MNPAVYTVASGGFAAQVQMDVVAQNLANVSTAGYKSAQVLFRVRPLGPAPTDPLDPLERQTAAQMVEMAVARDFSQGPVRDSGNALDVALLGEGFFAVGTAKGERYTRQGTFALDGSGHLVTQGGERVQGPQGDLRLPPGEVEFAGDGGIRVDGEPVGRLRVVTFDDPQRLVAEGGALFAAPPDVAPVALDPAAVRLQPGAVEGANVDAVAGLIELVQVARGYESYMQALRQLDAVAQRGIQEIGRV
jgi:flagellar basal body rod protein FlgG